MINRITLTGADDSIAPIDLISTAIAFDLLKSESMFNHIEWGILLSRKSMGGKRFPSKDWLNKLVEVKRENSNMKLSGHLCGAFVREFLKGDFSFVDGDFGQDIWKLFERIQINTHGEPHESNYDAVLGFIESNPDKEFIFQYDDRNTELVHKLADNGVKNISALYDLSHGAGVLPKNWNKPLGNIKTGYAGGISPNNILRVMYDIHKLIGDTSVWIDMETHIRSLEDKLFDLAKVNECLRCYKTYQYTKS